MKSAWKTAITKQQQPIPKSLESHAEMTHAIGRDECEVVVRFDGT